MDLRGLAGFAGFEGFVGVHEREVDPVAEDLRAGARRVGEVRLAETALHPDAHRAGPAHRAERVPVSAADVVRLCLKYRQNAIVWWEKGELPALWWFECPKAG